VAIWCFCGHLVFLWPIGVFVVIWCFCGHLVLFGTFLYTYLPILVCCTEKNLATMECSIAETILSVATLPARRGT
jgi:hypothetical protein